MYSFLPNVSEQYISMINKKMQHQAEITELSGINQTFIPDKP
jgi:hypothetical protein